MTEKSSRHLVIVLGSKSDGLAEGEHERDRKAFIMGKILQLV
jgi:hypothetical protein